MTGRGTRAFAVLAALAVSLAALTGTGRADPGEEPDLQVEIVGLKPGSRREVVVRVTNVSDWWSDATRLTVETISPTSGQRRTFDVPDLNTLAEAPLPNQVELTYTLAADCDGHAIKASLTAGTNYMGDKEAYLDDNVAEQEVCPKRGGAPSAASPDEPREQGAASGGSSAPNVVAGGPRLNPAATGGQSPIRPMAPTPTLAPAPGSPKTDLAIEAITGTRETYLVTYALPYDFKLRNDGTDVTGGLVVDIRTSGVARVAANQPSGSAQDWKDLGFTCSFAIPDNSPKQLVRCQGGSLRSGESVTPRVFVLFTGPGAGSIEAHFSGFQTSPGKGLEDVNPENNVASLDVQILRVP